MPRARNQQTKLLSTWAKCRASGVGRTEDRRTGEWEGEWTGGIWISFLFDLIYARHHARFFAQVTSLPPTHLGGRSLVLTWAAWRDHPTLWPP